MFDNDNVTSQLQQKKKSQKALQVLQEINTEN